MVVDGLLHGLDHFSKQRLRDGNAKAPLHCSGLQNGSEVELTWLSVLGLTCDGKFYFTMLIIEIKVPNLSFLF